MHIQIDCNSQSSYCHKMIADNVAFYRFDGLLVTRLFLKAYNTLISPLCLHNMFRHWFRFKILLHHTLWETLSNNKFNEITKHATIFIIINTPLIETRLFGVFIIVYNVLEYNSILVYHEEFVYMFHLTLYYLTMYIYTIPNAYKSLKIFSRDSRNQTILFIKSACAYIVARHEIENGKMCVLN